MPHGGLPNRDSELVRLSVDVRAQPAAEPQPVIGRVVDASAHTISVGNGPTVCQLRVDAATILRTDMLETVQPEDLLGRRVIVATDGGRASFVRLAV